MKPFRAVLFDFDGVIAHTHPIIQQALWKFFRERKMAIAESEFHENGWASKSLVQISTILWEKYDIHLEVDEIRSHIWHTQVELMDMGLESDPSLIPFLEYCRQRYIQIAIGSNSIRNRVEWVIKKMKIDDYFLHDVTHPEQWYRIIGATELTHHKPDPEVWIKSAEMLEIPIEECLIIEDGLPGLTGAKECGARGIYYQRFCRPEKACVEIAEKSIGSFSELLQ
jgi:beta-phosphoglucomutase